MSDDLSKGDRFTCVGKGGEYEYLGLVTGAGTLSEMERCPLYRDIKTGRIFIRTPKDFNLRMMRLHGTRTPVATAPTTTLGAIGDAIDGVFDAIGDIIGGAD